MIRAVAIFSALLMLCVLSLLLGARSGVGLTDLSALIVAPEPNDASGIVVRDMRGPRTLGALIAGGALGVAGAVIQSLSRNPLADPGLLGVNAGAAFAIVLAVWVFGPLSASQLIYPALGGAACAAGIVWVIGSVTRSPVSLVLAGAALTAMLTAGLRGLVLLDPFALDALRVWAVGSVEAVRIADIRAAVPLCLVGLVMAALCARRLDAMILGDDLSIALGLDLRRTRILSLGATAALSGAAVIVAGPLAFVGLVAPHLARLTGNGGSTIPLLVASGAIGAALVLLADIAGRILFPGIAIAAGLGVTLIGGPFLIWLVRRQTAGAA